MKHLICALFLGTLMGCINPETPDQGTPKDPSTWVVCVGMENSQFAGACPGAEYDCKRMTKLFKQYSTNVNSFISAQATYSNVKAAMTRAALNADLFIFYYSGHGGAVKTGNKQEADGQDEFLCFWDREMMDDEVWSIISKAKGRVVLMFDACHSQTMFKVPSFRRFVTFSATHTETSTDGKRILVMSGCPDDTYSYGDVEGGKFTNTFLKYFNPDLSYDAIWSRIESDKNLLKYEKVQRTIIGQRFTSSKIFR